jgi:hypothetical protein
MNMKCHICSLEASSEQTFSSSLEEVHCARCGTYQITYAGVRSLGRLDVPLYILSAALRYSSDRGKVKVVDVKNGKGNETEIVQSFPMPKDPLDKVDLLLKGISLLGKGLGSISRFDWEVQKSLIATDSIAEVGTTLKLAREMGFIEAKALLGGGEVSILPEGWKRIRELDRSRPVGNNAFVAFHFSPEMKDVYFRVYEPTLISNGYELAPIVNPVHNEKIDDMIISEIRKSSLLVADFTDERPNVYYEAGFAFGLDIPIIRTIKSGHKPHFDTRQYNHIVWTDEDDLRTQLIARIKAIPGR